MPAPSFATTQIGTFYLTALPISNPALVLNPNYYGNPHGAGYTQPPRITVTSPAGSGATFQSLLNPIDGSIISVVIASGGSGYQVGQPLVFTPVDGQGSGATALVTSVTSNGTINAVSFAPTGIVQQLLFSITGSSTPQIYYTSAGSTFVANGVVGAFSTEVSGYYANASALETNLEDLTQALNLISATSSDYAGKSTAMGIPSQRTALVWYKTNSSGSYTSTTLDSNISVYNFLNTYASITLNTSLGGTSEQQVNIQAINAGIAPVQNSLQTQQAFLNSAVSTLQTQISQFSQVINQYFSSMQGVANAIG